MLLIKGVTKVDEKTGREMECFEQMTDIWWEVKWIGDEYYFIQGHLDDPHFGEAYNAEFVDGKAEIGDWILVQEPLDAVQEIDYTLNGYQRDAQRVADPSLSPRDKLLAATLGLNGEAGEFAELVKKEIYHARESTKENKISELGDILWYLQDAARAIGITLDVVARYNIHKLRKRYPDGFVAGGGNRDA